MTIISPNTFFSEVQNYLNQRNTSYSDTMDFLTKTSPNELLSNKNAMRDLQMEKTLETATKNGILKTKLIIKDDVWLGPKFELTQKLPLPKLQCEILKNIQHPNLHKITLREDKKIIQRLFDRVGESDKIKFIQAQYIPITEVVFLTQSKTQDKKSYTRSQIEQPSNSKIFGDQARANYLNWELQPTAFDSLGV